MFVSFELILLRLFFLNCIQADETSKEESPLENDEQEDDDNNNCKSMQILWLD